MSNFNSYASQLGSMSGSTSSHKNYPWQVQNYKKAGESWTDPNKYTRQLRSYASQGIQQYSENPTAYTKEVENDVNTQYLNTVNAQADKADNANATAMARTGLAGQPVAAANAAQLGYQRGKDVANKATDTKTQFAVQRQNDYVDWFDRIQKLNATDRQFKLERDKMDLKRAMFSSQMQAARQANGGFMNSIMPWATMAGNMMSGLGTLAMGEAATAQPISQGSWDI